MENQQEPGKEELAASSKNALARILERVPLDVKIKTKLELMFLTFADEYGSSSKAASAAEIKAKEGAEEVMALLREAMQPYIQMYGDYVSNRVLAINKPVYMSAEEYLKQYHKI